MIYILDTETTDSDPKTCEAIELAYAKFDSLEEFTQGIRWDVTSSRYLPQNPCTYGALATHHILPEELLDCPPSSEARIPFDCDYLIGHRIDFDWEVLGAPHDVKRICTLAIMRSLYPLLDSHTQSACMYFIDGAKIYTRDRLRNAHSAAADIALTADILHHIINQTGIRDIEELYRYSEEARIPKIMAFGKHKGKPVEEVDYGYIKWYRSQSDTDPYLLEAFRRVTDAKYKGR